MGPSSIAARLQHSLTRAAFRSYLAEFISTFFFVLAVVGSSMSSRKLMPDTAGDPSGLVVFALANAFAMSTAVYVSENISGGHVNPAVTFALAVGGHVSVSTAIFYWVSQMLASVMACLFLKITTAGHHVAGYVIASEMTGFGASLLEGALTFGLVYTVYAAGDPRRGSSGGVGVLAIGFMAGANVLAAAPFSGGSMNPACAFGAALLSGTFKNQAVYWVGPLIGAALAVLLYDNVMCADPPPDPAAALSL